MTSILLVHSFYRSTLPSGENDVVRSQADLLRRNDFDVKLWGRTSPDSAGIADQIRTGLRIARGNGTSPLEAIAAFKPDLVHVHNLFPNIGTSWMSHCSVPIVQSLHNYRTVCANGILMRDGHSCTVCLNGTALQAVRYSCYRNSRVATLPVIGFQRQFREAIERYTSTVIYSSDLSEKVLSPHLKPKRSIVLPNFVTQTAETNIGVASSIDRPFHLVLGRLTAEKGLANLLEVWPTEKTLVIAGDGPQRADLEALAVGMDVHFRGFVSSEERDRLLREATSLVLPSVTLEVDPLVIPQALSAGTPCIVRVGTADAELATRSPAIQVFAGPDSLVHSLRYAENHDLCSEAISLYTRRWSADTWLQRYVKDVIEPSVGI